MLASARAHRQRGKRPMRRRLVDIERNCVDIGGPTSQKNETSIVPRPRRCKIGDRGRRCSRRGAEQEREKQQYEKADGKKRPAHPRRLSGLRALSKRVSSSTMSLSAEIPGPRSR